MSNFVDVDIIKRKINNLNKVQCKSLSMDRKDDLFIIDSTPIYQFNSKDCGKWIIHNYDSFTEAECSNCGKYVDTSYAHIYYDFKYCPYCGSYNENIENNELE